MGMSYENLDLLERDFPFINSGNSLHSIKLFLIGDDEIRRLEACQRTQTMLEKMLSEGEFSEGSDGVSNYEVKIVNLAENSGLDYVNLVSSQWKRIGNKAGSIFIPIFHNAGGHPNLAQNIFDNQLPGVISVTNQEYENVINRSKKDMYSTLRL